MQDDKTFTPEQLRYLTLLSREFPTVQAASREIIQLQALRNLPKGCEHFISDVHGEYEAFLHVLNSCSGVIREKLDDLYDAVLPRAELDELATLIYYPTEKLAELKKSISDLDEYYTVTIHRLVELCRLIASRYTRSEVRSAIPSDYMYIVDELLSTDRNDPDKKGYFEGIISSIVDTGQAQGFIESICAVIKRLAVKRLHLVGDIFDRGPRADIIMDSLLEHHSVDIQWGNHDILWMGAASGSRTLVATVLANCLHYNNLEVVETGYGISLRPLSVFANDVYKDCDVSRFSVTIAGDEDQYSEKDKLLSARMHKAITMILFKLEGQKILRHPSYGMDDRLLLDKINYSDQSITIRGKKYHLEDCDFPTVDPEHPYDLTEEESVVIDQLTSSFLHSEKLQRHVRFLYSKGSLYKIYNGNLLFHGCIPMKEDGTFMTFSMGGKERKGREYLDWADAAARRAYYLPLGSEERKIGMDFLWFLWAGRNSPIFGRDRMTTFERRLIADESAWTEPKNPYYTLYNDPAVCESILKEFGLDGKRSHIINGHVPVKAGKGESPIKGGGKLIVIDGGFCKAYQKTSGIAGYTLTYDDNCLRIISHQPFAGKEKAVKENFDITSTSSVVEQMDHRIMLSETDSGRKREERIADLRLLLSAFRAGAILEKHQ